MKFHKVTLTDCEVKILEEITRKGKRSAIIIRMHTFYSTPMRVTMGESRRMKILPDFWE